MAHQGHQATEHPRHNSMNLPLTHWQIHSNMSTPATDYRWTPRCTRHLVFQWRMHSQIKPLDRACFSCSQVRTQQSPGMLLPSATAMGATFDRRLMRSVGRMLGRETREKGCHVMLAPTVCLQPSPLIGRGFEAFGEDSWLSGTLASDSENGVQFESVACAIIHYAAHDQSTMSQEDSIWASERTLRELHLLPFQIAAKQANPWSIMTSYHKINGIHTAEHPWLINQVLREDWGWDGLVMSDWFGTYSTTEALDAGLDLEMPGPTIWRGQLLFWAVISKKPEAGDS
ncbi:glycoside hydrolase superfamily [Aspergillus insuetus]